MFSRFFIDRPIFAAVISIFLVLAGLSAMRNLPIAQYPEIAPPVVTVAAVYPGASAEVLEQTVAAPIENAINGVPRMLYMSSNSSSQGVVQIQVTFEIASQDGSNRRFADHARGRHGSKISFAQEVASRLSHAFQIQRMPEMVCVPLRLVLHGASRRVVNAVTVQLAQRGVAGVELQMDVAQRDDGHVLREPRADGVLHLAGVQLAGRDKVAHVAGCMDAGVGSPAASQLHLMSHDAPDGLFEHSLDGAQPRLLLPSVELRPVIRHQEEDLALHARHRTTQDGVSQGDLPSSSS